MGYGCSSSICIRLLGRTHVWACYIVTKPPKYLILTAPIPLAFAFALSGPNTQPSLKLPLHPHEYLPRPTVSAYSIRDNSTLALVGSGPPPATSSQFPSQTT